MLVCRVPPGQQGLLFILRRSNDDKVSFTVCELPPPPVTLRQILPLRCLLSSSPSSQVNSQEVKDADDKYFFSVRLLAADSAQPELFCCLYKSKEGRYSAYSPYLQLERQKGASQVAKTAVRG